MEKHRPWLSPAFNRALLAALILWIPGIALGKGYLARTAPVPLRFAVPRVVVPASFAPLPEVTHPEPPPTSFTLQPADTNAPVQFWPEALLQAQSAPGLPPEEPSTESGGTDAPSAATDTGGGTQNTLPPQAAPSITPDSFVELFRKWSEESRAAPQEAPSFVPPGAQIPRSRATYRTPPAGTP